MSVRCYVSVSLTANDVQILTQELVGGIRFPFNSYLSVVADVSQHKYGKRQISPITRPRCPESSRKLIFPD